LNGRYDRESSEASQTVNRQNSINEGTEAAVAKQDPVSPQLAALARKEKLIRDQVKATQERSSCFESERAEANSYKQWKERIAQDPLGVLNEAGISYEQLSKNIMEDDPSARELKKVQQEIEALKKSQVDSQTKQYEQLSFILSAKWKR